MSEARKNKAAKKGAGKVAAEERTRRTFTLTRRAPIYLVLWIGALIFTQALRSTASSIFFTFVTLLPLVSLIYLLCARGALKIHMLSEKGKVEKYAPYSYNFRVINEFPIAFPFTEAILLLPQSNSVRCSERRVRISMSPHESYTVKNTVRFRFRGTYEIGVRCFYVYDFFRMMCLRIDIDSYESVEVLPRKLGIDEDENRTVSDSANHTVKLPNSYDKLEVSDIREYRLGDTLKSIHWNLSSKSEELVVRDYNTGTTNLTCIFCDMTAHFPDEPPIKAEPEVKEEPDEEVPAAEPEKAEDAEKTGKDKKNKKEKNKKIKKDKKRRKARRESRKPSQEDKDTSAPPVCDVHALAADEYYDDMNEFCADGVVELTVAAVLRELRAGSSVRLLWFDDRAVMGAFAYEFSTPADFDLVFDLFATAPVLRGGEDRKVTSLAAMIPDACEARSIYVIPAVDDETVAAFSDMRGVAKGDTTTEVMLYDPEERYLNRDERTAYLEGCRTQLAANGIRLISRRLPEAEARKEDNNVG